MTPQQAYELIREKAIAANPFIMEWKDGPNRQAIADVKRLNK
jgi:hypothetical protein